MDKQILWHLPGFNNHFRLYAKLIETIIQFPEILREGHSIHCVYGSPSYAIWNGGSNVMGGNISLREDIGNQVKLLNNHGISVALTWTNHLINNYDLYDRYCNMITEECHNRMNYIELNSHLMYCFIKDKYPTYKTILSCTRYIYSDVSYCLNLSVDDKNDYDLIVLNEDNNSNLWYSPYLKQYATNNLEILVNQPCSHGCKNRRNHYTENEKSILEFKNTEFHCESSCENVTPYDASVGDNVKYPIESNFLSRTDVEKLSELGFKHFKIEGRTSSPQCIISWINYYMIKDEYKEFVNSLFGMK